METKKQVIKIRRDENSYLVRTYLDHELISKSRIQEPISIKRKLKGIEKETSFLYEDENGAMNFKVHAKDGSSGTIQFENYKDYKNDILFEDIVRNVKREASRRVRVIDTKVANHRLIKRASITVASAAALGVVALLMGFTKNPKMEDVEVLKDSYTKEITTENDSLETESKIEEEIEILDFDDYEEKETTPVDNIIKTEENYQDIEKASETVFADSYLEEQSNTSIFSDEELNLTELYNQPLIPVELNLFMKNIAEEYVVPYRALIAIAHVESDGKFDNHGMVGCSNDVGYMQINPGNFRALSEHFGVPLDSIEDMLKYDDQFNIKCATYILSDICKRNIRRNGTLDEIEMFREYNGGTKFKDIPVTIDYVNKIYTAIDNYYNDNNLMYIENESEEVRAGRKL